YQEFAITGEATLDAPPGTTRVVVSRGYDWELFDQTIEVAAGKTVELAADLTRSVEQSGYLCADFHMHTSFSADATDPARYKGKGAIADGLDILVSSEHEWVVDFQPLIAELGLERWAFGMPSEELTTFDWGHFGVIPLTPQPDALNNGAVDW